MAVAAALGASDAGEVWPWAGLGRGAGRVAVLALLWGVAARFAALRRDFPDAIAAVPPAVDVL
ncbi:MAG TPA: hypothetical protein VF916_03260, partial [Ktedonobacterales bacterium]